MKAPNLVSRRKAAIIVATTANTMIGLGIPSTDYR